MLIVSTCKKNRLVEQLDALQMALDEAKIKLGIQANNVDALLTIIDNKDQQIETLSKMINKYRDRSIILEEEAEKSNG